MSHAVANPSTAQTNTPLIAAEANRVARLRSIYISSDAEMTVSFENSVDHDSLFKLYVAARGGASVDVGVHSLRGQGIDYSTSAVGNVFIRVEYGWD